MSPTTLIFDPEQARIPALAEDANRNTRLQPANSDYPVPFIEVAGVQSFLRIDDDGVAHVEIITLDGADGPLADAGGRIPVVVEIDHEYRVYSSARAAKRGDAGDKRPYTVIGVVDAGERIIAGVLPGEHSTVDTGDAGPRVGCRFAEFIWATSPDEAAALALNPADDDMPA
ncbi:hypothetical protein [Micromonospora arborensis]|uniref:hypothetical protein n=1 Tax=Micromonospora arborensis TaxID=2116518 RepID=UPI0037166779